MKTKASALSRSEHGPPRWSLITMTNLRNRKKLFSSKKDAPGCSKRRQILILSLPFLLAALRVSTKTKP
jgi:hypothetical protein